MSYGYHEGLFMSYSVDFRKCVVENVEAGMKWDDAVATFSISRATLSKWIKLFKEKGNFEDAPRKAYKVRKIDADALLLQLEKTPDATLAELAEIFGCVPHAVCQRLQKLGITRKKNDAVFRARRRKAQSVSEGNRDAKS